MSKASGLRNNRLVLILLISFHHYTLTSEEIYKTFGGMVMKNFYSLGVFLFFVSVLFIGIGTRNALAGVPPTACFSTSCTIRCEDQPGDVCDGDEGTSGADIICGSDQVDIINAGKGNDMVCGHGGNDIISGGQSDDCLSGGNDEDTISGGLGNDRIEGDSGNDDLDGGKGNDRINGGTGDDDIYGGDDSDTNTTSPGFGSCETTGGLFGDDHEDYIEGGMGRDLISGNYGDDECHGGPQNDTFSFCECGDVGPLPPSPQADGETSEAFEGPCT